MSQQRLKFRGEKKSIAQKQDEFDVGNEEAARIILADPESFGGEQAGLVRWSRLVAKRLKLKFQELEKE